MAAANHASNSFSRKTLFVRGLPYSTSDADLEESFSECGPVKTCFTIKEAGSKDCKGFGYVVFCTSDDAAKALNSIRSIGGRRVHVSLARKRGPKDGKEKKQNEMMENLEQVHDGEMEDRDVSMDTGELSSHKLEGDAVRKRVSSKSKRQAPSTAVGRTLVISGFGEGVTKKQIFKCCRKLGDLEGTVFPVEGMEVPTAYVTYKSYKEARSAVSKMNNRTFKGATLKAIIKSHEGKSPSSRALKKSRLIVRNLSFQATEEDVTKAFSPFGTVHEVKIPTSSDGKKRGFGFVQFTNVIHAAKAMDSLNGTKIRGRTVAIDWVVPKTLYENSKLSQHSEHEEIERKDSSPIDVDHQESGDEDDTEGIDDDDENVDNSEESEADDQSDFNSDSSDEEMDVNHEDMSDKVNDDDITSSGSSGEEGRSEEEVESESEASAPEDDEEDSKPPKSKRRKVFQRSDVDEGKTVFVRNVPFDCEEEDIADLFSQFGEIMYCKPVINQDTGVPKGTAFVKFSTSEEAQECIQAASSGRQGSHSEGLVMEGRRLDVTVAVSRQQAASLKKNKTEANYKEDRRNLYLSKEGQILPGSEAAQELSKSDMSKRMKSLQEKKTKLANPNFFVSRTRLSVRNMPPGVDEKHLKRIFMNGAAGTRPRLKQVKILRSTDKVDAKGVGRSKGCGFVEFTTHESALAALRAVNNNPDILPSHRRLIVEFAIENVKALKLQEDRKRRQVKYSLEGSKGGTTETTENGKTTGLRSKRKNWSKGGDRSSHSKSWKKPKNEGGSHSPKSGSKFKTGNSNPNFSSNSNPRLSGKIKKKSSHTSSSLKKRTKDLAPSKKNVTTNMQDPQKAAHTGKKSQKTVLPVSKNPVLSHRSRKRRKERELKNERHFDKLIDAHTQSSNT